MAPVHVGIGFLDVVGKHLAALGFAANSSSSAKGSRIRPRVPAGGEMNQETVASAMLIG